MTYEDLAREHGVLICRACREMSPTQHMTGRKTGRTVHWSRVRVSRVGTFRFLRLVFAARLPPGAPAWKRVWLSNTRAHKACAEMGIRIPRKLSENDRAYVRWQLEDPRTRRRNSEARQAWKWATRTSTATASTAPTPSTDGSSGAQSAD